MHEHNEQAETHVTTDHDEIRRWADDRHASPATIDDPQNPEGIGALRFDFDFGFDTETSDLRQISWDQWLAAFDERGLSFSYQDTRADGTPSNYFTLEEHRTGTA